jgi:hypothetical protein
MKAYAKYICLLPLLALLLGGATAGATEEAVAQTATTALTSTESKTPTPQSVFVIPASPKEGRNPFFPRSKVDAPVVPQRTDVIETASFVLNGITSPPKRTAMINGRTFEVGEVGEVKFPNGAKISIQCVEIRDDAAIIVVGTQRRELRMRAGV